MKNVDDALRKMIFTRIRIGKRSFDFLEGLLAVCITVVGLLLRASFETGLPHWLYLLAEWYLAFASAALVWRLTGSRMRALGGYSILLVLPTIVADGTILRSDACVGALLFISALLLLESGHTHWFALAAAATLMLDARYIGLFFACIVLWRNRKLRAEELLLLLLAGIVGMRGYRLWLWAGYTVNTFQWPNIYEIVGKAVVQGRLVDPAAMLGLFLTFALLIMAVWMLGMGTIPDTPVFRLRLFLFFLLAACYFLPYMHESCGYLPCILAVIYFLLDKCEFSVPMLLQIVTFAGYQENLNGESMMPMALFSALQFLVLAWLGVQIFQEAGVISLWNRKK